MLKNCLQTCHSRFSNSAVDGYLIAEPCAHCVTPLPLNDAGNFNAAAAWRPSPNPPSRQAPRVVPSLWVSRVRGAEAVGYAERRSRWRSPPAQARIRAGGRGGGSMWPCAGRLRLSRASDTSRTFRLGRGISS